MSRGFAAISSSGSRFHFSSRPGRKFSMRMSLSIASFRTNAWSSGRWRSAVTDSFPRDCTRCQSESAPLPAIPHVRSGSPRSGCSILMTSAPKSANIRPANGPAISVPSSRTFRSSSGPIRIIVPKCWTRIQHMDRHWRGQGFTQRSPLPSPTISPVSDRYAVIGNPIRHSMSPEIHRAFARETGDDIEYTAIECPRDGFADAVRAFREGGGRGLNVTAPFKLEAYRLADESSERATIAGSVNTLRFDGPTVLADNFDGVGLIRDIQDNMGFPIEGTRVLLLGAGGAARGLLKPLIDQGPSQVFLANRSPQRARAVADLAGRYHPVRGGGYDE